MPSAEFQDMYAVIGPLSIREMPASILRAYRADLEDLHAEWGADRYLERIAEIDRELSNRPLRGERIA
jgi:hypothetical protein